MNSFIIGLAIGLALTTLFNHLYLSAGVLKVDHSNPDKDVYRLCIKNLDDISKKKNIKLKVDNYADLTHK